MDEIDKVLFGYREHANPLTDYDVRPVTDFEDFEGFEANAREL
jgi:hypothetical protein